MINKFLLFSFSKPTLFFLAFGISYFNVIQSQSTNQFSYTINGTKDSIIVDGLKYMIQESRFPDSDYKMNETDDSVIVNGVKYWVGGHYFPNIVRAGNEKFYKEYDENHPTGKWFYFYSDNSIREMGELTAFYKLDGIWTSFYPNGNKRSEGKFINGLKSGKWQTWYENGKLRSIAEYKKFNGRRITKVPIYGQVYTMWQEAPIVGKKWGIVHIHEWVNVNEYIEYYENGKIKYNLYFDGKGRPQKNWNIYYESEGILSQYTFDRHHNIKFAKTYYENGSMMAKEYYVKAKQSPEQIAIKSWNQPVRRTLEKIYYYCDNGTLLTKYTCCLGNPRDSINFNADKYASSNNCVFDHDKLDSIQEEIGESIFKCGSNYCEDGCYQEDRVIKGFWGGWQLVRNPYKEVEEYKCYYSDRGVAY